MEYLGPSCKTVPTSSVLIKQTQTEQMKSFHLDGVHAGKIYDGTHTPPSIFELIQWVPLQILYKFSTVSGIQFTPSNRYHRKIHMSKVPDFSNISRCSDPIAAIVAARAHPPLGGAVPSYNKGFKGTEIQKH